QLSNKGETCAILISRGPAIELANIAAATSRTVLEFRSSRAQRRSRRPRHGWQLMLASSAGARRTGVTAADRLQAAPENWNWSRRTAELAFNHRPRDDSAINIPHNHILQRATWVRGPPKFSRRPPNWRLHDVSDPERLSRLE